MATITNGKFTKWQLLLMANLQNGKSYQTKKVDFCNARMYRGQNLAAG